jgi:hypothetical protein
MHYKRWRRRGAVHDITPEETFFARVTEGSSGCWLWDRPMDTTGYGQFSDNRKMWLAHRWSYEFLRAEIPDGLVLDHLCKTHLCVNPWHAEPVTQKVNVLRGDGLTAAKAAQTSCIHGHPFDEANTYIDKRGHRSCQTCRRETSRRHQQSRRPVGANQRG